MTKRKRQKLLESDQTKKPKISPAGNEPTRSNNFRVINRKQGNGCNNWMSFKESEKLKQTGDMSEPSMKSKPKIPILKRCNDGEKGNNKPFVFLKNHQKSTSGKLTSLLAIDCEMVGIGEDGHISILARVSIVNSLGECVYDKYVKPTDPVTDYRTPVSGIRPSDLENAIDFHTVQSEVACILKGRILVGHSLKNDLDVLMLKHPYRLIRDTSRFSKFHSESKRTLSLKAITEKFLNVKIQTDEHNSVEDARAAMQLYMTYRNEWEQERRENMKRQMNRNKTKNVIPSNAEAKKSRELKIVL